MNEWVLGSFEGEVREVIGCGRLGFFGLEFRRFSMFFVSCVEEKGVR